MNIYLTGFMGAGKTHCGRMLADKLGKVFFDTDDETRKTLGTTVGDYMRKQGEDAFREKETEVFGRLSMEDSAVISTGGGLLLSSENLKNAKNSGIVIFIDTPFYLCHKRVAEDFTRPLAHGRKKAQLQELYNSRYKQYASAADFIVNGDRADAAIISDIETYLKSRG